MTEIIDENNYSDIMKNRVLPELEKAASFGEFLTSDGIKLRYVRYAADDGGSGSVVICHGFTESMRKYSELAYYFHNAGYNVVIYDARGHGHSTREVTDNEVTHIGRFSHYMNDLAEIARIEKERIGGRPLMLYAHSMGGAAGALCLETNPGLFDAAVLNAPMIKPYTGKTPVVAAKILAGIFCFFGMSKKRAFTCGHFNPDEKVSSSACNSAARFDYYLGFRKSDVLLQNCAYSYGWLKESLAVGRRILSKKSAVQVKIPVLLFNADNDAFVRRDAQEKFVSMIQNGRIEYITGTKHEIYYSENAVLGRYIDKVLDFYRNSVKTLT